MINDKTSIRAAGNVVFNEFDGEMVLMCVDSGKYIDLNGTASHIWTRISEDWVNFAELCEGLMSDFEVDRESCYADTKALLEDLSSRGLIELQS